MPALRGTPSNNIIIITSEHQKGQGLWMVTILHAEALVSSNRDVIVFQGEPKTFRNRRAFYDV
jgi:hypothetical protein